VNVAEPLFLHAGARFIAICFIKRQTLARKMPCFFATCVSDIPERTLSLPGVAFFLEVNFPTNIWRLELTSPTKPAGPATRVISSSRGEWNPQVSPDGKYIAFESERSGYPEITFRAGLQCIGQRGRKPERPVRE
jgi:hypothetical protein